SQDSLGHILLWVACFLRGSRNSIESDIGKEDHTGSSKHARPAILAKSSFIRRDEGRPVGTGHSRVLREPVGSDAEEDQQYGHFYNNDEVVEVGGFLDTDDENRGDERDTDKPDQLELTSGVRYGGRD